MNRWPVAGQNSFAVAMLEDNQQSRSLCKDRTGFTDIPIAIASVGPVAVTAESYPGRLL